MLRLETYARAFNIDYAAFEELITFTNDEQCKAILADVGLASIEEKPPFTKSTAFFNWKNHRAMAFYEYGHPLSADNGYTIVMLPFSVDAESAANLFALIIKLTAASGPAQLAA